MSVTFKKGDIFASECQAICNAVNCVGVMGAGLAAAFKLRFPASNKDYVGYCTRGELKPGGVHVFSENGKYIFNVATKGHFIENSRYEFITDALVNIANEARKLGITSVAIPALGCGLGGLEWSKVKKQIEEADLNGLEVEVFEPL